VDVTPLLRHALSGTELVNLSLAAANLSSLTGLSAINHIHDNISARRAVIFRRYRSPRLKPAQKSTAFQSNTTVSSADGRVPRGENQALFASRELN